MSDRDQTELVIAIDRNAHTTSGAMMSCSNGATSIAAYGISSTATSGPLLPMQGDHLDPPSQALIRVFQSETGEIRNAPEPLQARATLWLLAALFVSLPIALGEFVRVLRPGGRLLLTLPDLQSVAELVVRDQLETEAYMSPSGPITPLDMIFGHGASLARGDHHMAHKCGFTVTTLRGLLDEAGLVGVKVWQGKACDIWATGYKHGL